LISYKQCKNKLVTNPKKIISNYIKTKKAFNKLGIHVYFKLLRIVLKTISIGNGLRTFR